MRSLSESYLHLIGGGAQLEGVYYFSALAQHLEATKPDVTRRHRTFMACLEATGVKIELARFKKKRIYCSTCLKELIRHEEKETDVAIAAKIFELLHENRCDTIVLMTGDTDIAPAVRLAKRLFPKARITFAFPFERKNKELEKLVTGSFTISKENLAKHQFPDPFVTLDGKKYLKPVSW